MPQSLITRRTVSHKAGNGSRNSRQQRFRFRQRIDGSGHHVGPRADFRVMIAVSRQLAETKWSPGAAIEKKHHTALRN